MFGYRDLTFTSLQMNLEKIFQDKNIKRAQEKIISNIINKHINPYQVPQHFYPYCPCFTHYIKEGFSAEDHNITKLL